MLLASEDSRLPSLSSSLQHGAEVSSDQNRTMMYLSILVRTVDISAFFDHFDEDGNDLFGVISCQIMKHRCFRDIEHVWISAYHDEREKDMSYHDQEDKDIHHTFLASLHN